MGTDGCSRSEDYVIARLQVSDWATWFRLGNAVRTVVSPAIRIDEPPPCPKGEDLDGFLHANSYSSFSFSISSSS
jgi:hypothetical protein